MKHWINQVNGLKSLIINVNKKMRFKGWKRSIIKKQYLGAAAAEALPSLFCHCDCCNRSRRAGGENIRVRSGVVINDTLVVDFPPDIYFQSLKFTIQVDPFKMFWVVFCQNSRYFCAYCYVFVQYFSNNGLCYSHYIWYILFY